MSPEKSSSQGDGKLRQAVTQLDATMRQLSEEQRKASRLDSHLLISFLKGVASGLGVLVSVAIVVPIVISMMRSINWVPIIGKFVTQIATQIEQAQKLSHP